VTGAGEDPGPSTGKRPNLFVGRAGLRPGWGVLIFVLLLSLCIHVVLLFFPQLSNVGSVISPGSALLREAPTALLILGATWLMGTIERRRIGSYGLSGPRRLRSFAAGLGWGVALFALLVGMLVASGHLVFAGAALRGSVLVGYGLAWMLVFFLVAFAEEMLFRGYLQYTFARGMGFWPAATFLSVAFGLVHLRSENELVLGIAMVVLIGMVLSLCLKLSGSLWWGIGFHTAWDWAETFLFGTPNSGYLAEGHWLSSRPIGDIHWSGGSAGPEGSILMVPVLLAAALVITLTLRGRSRDRVPADERVGHVGT
jgi:membrane protease YdiL (CAAX protease family)